MGLVTALTVFIIIVLYIQHEFSFDRYHVNKDRIYRIVRQESKSFNSDNISSVTRPVLATALRENYPEITSVAQFFNANMVRRADNILIGVGEQNVVEESVWGASPEAFEIFTFKTIQGNPKEFLKNKGTAIISQSIAKKYYGDQNPIGELLLYRGEFPFSITGVIADMPVKSHFRMNIMLDYESLIEIEKVGQTNFHSYTYLMLNREGEKEKEAFEAKLAKLTDKDLNEKDNGRRQTQFKLQALKDIYLHSDFKYDLGAANDSRKLYIILLIAFLILGIASINYVNLNIAKAFKRIKEIGVRKTTGARRGQVITQFLFESVGLSFIALLISLAFVAYLLPIFSNFLDTQLRFDLFQQSWVLPFLLGLGLLIGILSGAYPALVVSSFPTSMVVKGGHWKGAGNNWLRNLLVVVQYTISGILIIGTLIIASQLKYIQNKDMGYQRDQILIMNIKDDQIRGKLPTFKEELRKIPNVMMVASSSETPNSIGMSGDAQWPGRPNEENIRLSTSFIDYDYLNLYEIPLVEGRGFSRAFSNEKKSILINESAVKALGWDQPLGRKMITWPGDTAQVVGIVNDFHQQSLHSDIKPLQFFFEDYTRTVSVKISGENIPQTLSSIEQVYQSFSPKYPFDYSFFDEVFFQAYERDLKTAQMASWAALLTIIIACLGLYGLSSYAAELRTKEIGIRKVLGASISSILLLLSREFLLMTLTAFLIAIPLGYWIMIQWLNNFSYHISLSATPFALSFLAMLLITMLTIGVLILRAARNNPVDALHYE